MRSGYYYIVVTIKGEKYFINKDMDYTDDFTTVLRFMSREDAQEFIEYKSLHEKEAKVIQIIE